MTFAATANCVVYQGANPVFADVDPDTALINPADVERKISARTRAVIAMDYAGQPCDYQTLTDIAKSRQIALVADACHALGGSSRGSPVGSLADLTAFSLHPVKQITSGEGGMVTTNNPQLAQRMRRFRNHGIDLDARGREANVTWFYEMVDLGYNYRLTDLQCALAISQLCKLPDWLARRRYIAGRYDDAFSQMAGLRPLLRRTDVMHAYHLYVVALELENLAVSRDEVFKALRAEGIGVNVHYIPVHLHPYYRRVHGTRPGDCPVAERLYDRILSLPIFPRMTDSDLQDVIQAVRKVIAAYLRVE
jgi:perosamine synthetase